MSEKKKRSEWVYDELLCFLGSAFFQVPVTSFIEANCLSKFVDLDAFYAQFVVLKRIFNTCFGHFLIFQTV